MNRHSTIFFLLFFAMSVLLFFSSTSCYYDDSADINKAVSVDSSSDDDDNNDDNDDNDNNNDNDDTEDDSTRICDPPDLKDPFFNAKSMYCINVLYDIYCEFGAPVIYKGIIYSHHQAFLDCRYEIDPVWNDILECWKQEDPFGPLSGFTFCLQGEGYAPEYREILDLQKWWKITHYFDSDKWFFIKAHALNFFSFVDYSMFNKFYYGYFAGALISPRKNSYLCINGFSLHRAGGLIFQYMQKGEG